jgi:hypothetical protein
VSEQGEPSAQHGENKKLDGKWEVRSASADVTVWLMGEGRVLGVASHAPQAHDYTEPTAASHVYKSTAHTAGEQQSRSLEMHIVLTQSCLHLAEFSLLLRIRPAKMHYK